MLRMVLLPVPGRNGTLRSSCALPHSLMMAPRSDAPVRAILGPTNTGKTHLAIERMCGHSSGVIGFPLRLLAREVYDRVVAMKGEKQVALLTGEERIVPPQARYFLCTAESMPVPGGDSHHDADMQRDFAFAAIDEAQLGIDPERGHVFTDRMLRARGRRPRAMPRWRCSSAARSIIWSPPTPSAWASTWTSPMSLSPGSRSLTGGATAA